MNVNDIKNRVQDYTGTYVADSDAAARVLRFINDARREVAKRNNWNCLKKHFNLYLPADKTAGTIALAAAGQTVTGTSTAFASTDVGSYINFGTTGQVENEWYRIMKVNSTTELIIDAKYVGTTALTASAYRIRKIYHRMPGDVAKVGTIMEFTKPQIMTELGEPAFVGKQPDFHSITGTPIYYNICGIYGREDTYTTGTVTGTINTRTLTGSSTAWLANVLPGDKITIGSYEYNVSSVDSDTQITLYQKLVVAASGTYTATTDPDSMLVRFSAPTDRIAIVPIEYYHYPYDLVNSTYDEDELTRRYGELIVDYVVAKEKRATDDQSWVTEQQKAEGSLRDTLADGQKGGILRPNLPKFGW